MMILWLQSLLSDEVFGSGEKYYLIFVFDLVFLKIFEYLDKFIFKQPDLLLEGQYFLCSVGAVFFWSQVRSQNMWILFIPG